PVAIVVRIELTASAGLRPVRFTDIRIPAQSSRGAPITAEVIRAGRFTVDASLTTRGGTKLGSTARLELTSTSYGVITVAITGVAGGVLILLVVIRLFRRVRAARAGTKDEVLVDA
ncbi:MAG TPA: glycoprotein, partial [Actinophytocola sp.]